MSLCVRAPLRNRELLICDHRFDKFPVTFGSARVVGLTVCIRVRSFEALLRLAHGGHKYIEKGRSPARLHLPDHRCPSSHFSIVVFVIMSATTRDEEVPPGEDTPLLSSESTLQKSSTPVPWAQVWILLVLQLAEPLTSQVIYPFTPEVCRLL